MKSEKEKMCNGELYNAADEQLTLERKENGRRLYAYNNLSPDEEEQAEELIRTIVNAKGSATFLAPFRCDYGYNIEVGDGFFANYGCTMLDVCRITIGKNVMLGPNVQIYTATHPLNAAERITLKEYGKPVTIGDNGWIGGGAIVCPGVTIGSNTTVAAGSVVTKSLPSDVLAGGNPCKIIRTLTT